MTVSNVATPIVAEDSPGDWLDEEDRESVRRCHAESVERWLDQASFASELFKLHAKYGIEQGDEGYRAYRLYLQQQYEKTLLTNGPMVDPLGEGCDCLFCRFDHDEISFRPARDDVASARVEMPAEVPVSTTRETHQATANEKPPIATEFRRVRRSKKISAERRIVPQPMPSAGSDQRQAAVAMMIEFKRCIPGDARKTSARSSASLFAHRRHTFCDRTAAGKQAAAASRGPP